MSMMIDFTPVQEGSLTLADLQANFSREDLIAATNEMIDTILGIVRGLPDAYVNFEPIDPAAYDEHATGEMQNKGWTLGHVIAHTTASGEESACIGSILARGAEVDFRARYEVPWESLTHTQQLIDRLEESRRIRVAYLNAWPDAPHLDVFWRKVARWGDINAIGYTLNGLKHEADHLGQIAEIIRQAKEALG